MQSGIYYLLVGVVCIASWLVGKYVTPEVRNAMDTAVSKFPELVCWGVAACKFIEQYNGELAGADKNKAAGEMIQEVANEAGISITLDQAMTIAQESYTEWQKGLADSTSEK